jgi:GNAT superfamily N-acetyltransferase
MELIKIRTAVPGDLETLLTFEQGIINAERPFDSTLKEGEIHYYDIAYMIEAPHVEVLVAEIGDEVIASGYVRIENSKVYLKHPQHGFMGFMFVKPAHRGKGVNRLIIEGLSKWSREQGVHELRLEVYDENDPAIKAYEKVGFSRLMVSMRKAISDNSNA